MSIRGYTICIDGHASFATLEEPQRHGVTLDGWYTCGIYTFCSYIETTGGAMAGPYSRQV